MIELIATIILIGSGIGLAVMVIRKLPALQALPPAPSPKSFPLFTLEKIRSRIKREGFSKEKLFHKVLSRLKVLALRLENKTERQLQSLRQRSKNDKGNPPDKYWQELKETKDSSNKNLPV